MQTAFWTAAGWYWHSDIHKHNFGGKGEEERGNILLFFLPMDCLSCVLFYGAKYYYQDSGGARRNTTQRPTKTPFLPRRTRKFYIMWRLVEGWGGGGGGLAFLLSVNIGASFFGKKSGLFLVSKRPLQIVLSVRPSVCPVCTCVRSVSNIKCQFLR